MVSQFFAPVRGGEERMVEDLSNELRSRGHDVAVATTTPPTDRRRQVACGSTAYPVLRAVFPDCTRIRCAPIRHLFPTRSP
jgi:hypothetical protein